MPPAAQDALLESAYAFKTNIYQAGITSQSDDWVSTLGSGSQPAYQLARMAIPVCGNPTTRLAPGHDATCCNGRPLATCLLPQSKFEPARPSPGAHALCCHRTPCGWAPLMAPTKCLLILPPASPSATSPSLPTPTRWT